jgi:hypothetical protein
MGFIRVVTLGEAEARVATAARSLERDLLFGRSVPNGGTIHPKEEIP